jgi:hypothetical protein
VLCRGVSRRDSGNPVDADCTCTFFSERAASGVVEKAEIMIEKAEELGMSISDYIDMYGEKDQADAGVPL